MISVIKFADVKLPKLMENKEKGYIRFGQDNLFPNTLLTMLNKSSKHNAIVLGKVNYIVGNGFKDELQANENETFNELLKKCALDIEVFGGCYVEGHWNALGEVGALYHLPYHKVRSNESNTQFFIKDWESLKNGDPIVLNGFNPELKEGKFVFVYKEYRPGLKTYTYPNYIGALNAIQTDIEVSKYHLSTISNGMFASKFINFYSGEPTEDKKAEVEKAFKDKFTGSDNAGSIILGFQKDPAKRPTIDDLSSTDLDKHFDILNKTIQQEIFAGHQVTSPMLFGIRVEGQLGGRSEMRDAYEIFKSTYVNDKQVALERMFTELAGLMGANVDLKIVPVEPIGVEFSEQTLLQIAPKEWLLEKAGIDMTKYQVAPTEQVQPGVNENLKNLSGRQWQNVSRIIRNFSQGKITAEQAKMLLKSSLGLSDEECNTMLSIDNEQEFSFEAELNEAQLIAEFEKVGEQKDNYFVLTTKKAYSFAEDITKNETDVLDLIRKDKRITSEVISKALKVDKKTVDNIINKLIDNGLLTSKDVAIGRDIITERTLTEPLTKITDEKPKLSEYKLMYSYEWKPGFSNKDIDSSRLFCKRLLSMNKFFSRADIETMSRRLGYSVWDRKGGWFGKSKECRHQWVSHVVIKKK